MYKIILSFIFSIHSIAFAADKFDSAHSIALEGTISHGFIYTTNRSPYTLQREIHAQLQYTIGQLNGLNGVTDMSRLQISIGDIEELENGELKVHYAAQTIVAWPRNLKIPETYELILPRSGGYAAQQLFFQKYGNNHECLDWNAHDVTISEFWYYYRPQRSRCALRVHSVEQEQYVVRLPMQMRVSAQNTEGKYPEYGKVWEDGKLIITAVFGKNEKTSQSASDAGARAYSQMYRDILQYLGEPTSTNLPDGASAGIYHREARLLFQLAGRHIEINLFLVDELQSASAEFRNQFSLLTQNSDFVSYSGHSGLGANIRALARMGSYLPGQYQIFLINGCDTFAYVDDALRNAHAAVNPGYGPDKFIDIITNAMPSYFHHNSRSNMAVIEALVNAKKTYREILSSFANVQKAVVTGEQDNLWPNPF